MEFSADEENAADLGQILKTLGFRLSARHRTKKVSLYSQGGDFIAVDDESEIAPVHLERIDHVAQTVAYDEMLTWLLFYTSIFDS